MAWRLGARRLVVSASLGACLVLAGVVQGVAGPQAQPAPRADRVTAPPPAKQTVTVTPQDGDVPVDITFQPHHSYVVDISGTFTEKLSDGREYTLDGFFCVSGCLDSRSDPNFRFINAATGQFVNFLSLNHTYDVTQEPLKPNASSTYRYVLDGFDEPTKLQITLPEDGNTKSGPGLTFTFAEQSRIVQFAVKGADGVPLNAQENVFTGHLRTAGIMRLPIDAYATGHQFEGEAFGKLAVAFVVGDRNENKGRGDDHALVVYQLGEGTLDTYQGKRTMHIEMEITKSTLDIGDCRRGEDGVLRLGDYPRGDVAYVDDRHCGMDDYGWNRETSGRDFQISISKPKDEVPARPR